jgi:hypothetical protein
MPRCALPDNTQDAPGAVQLPDLGIKVRWNRGRTDDGDAR